MEKRKWNWLAGITALIIMLNLALSSGLSQEKEKKRKWNPFKKKTEETVEAAEEAAMEGAEEESGLEEPLDWSWEEAPEEMAPGPMAPMAPPKQKVYRLHRVGEGENLHLLAAYYYGDARAWPRIYQLNKKQIRNPNLIRQGQILKVEVESDWKPRFELEEFKRKEIKRQAAIEQAKLPKPTIIKEQQTIIPTITPLTELEEEEEVEEVEEESPRAPLPFPIESPSGPK